MGLRTIQAKKREAILMGRISKLLVEVFDDLNEHCPPAATRSACI